MKAEVHLDIQNSKVGYQVPARGAVFVVPVEAKSCCVVDGISCRRDLIKAFEQHDNRGGGATLPLNTPLIKVMTETDGD